jgi:hypothetical protein
VRRYDVPQKHAVPFLIDLYDNPEETVQEADGESSIETRAWVAHAIFGELAESQQTFKQDRPVPRGATDPYVPPSAKAHAPDPLKPDSAAAIDGQV